MRKKPPHRAPLSAIREINRPGKQSFDARANKPKWANKSRIKSLSNNRHLVASIERDIAEDKLLLKDPEIREGRVFIESRIAALQLRKGKLEASLLYEKPRKSRTQTNRSYKPGVVNAPAPIESVPFSSAPSELVSAPANLLVPKEEFLLDSPQEQNVPEVPPKLLEELYLLKRTTVSREEVKVALGATLDSFAIPPAEKIAAVTEFYNERAGKTAQATTSITPDLFVTKKPKHVLPTVAPLLWQERDKSLKMSPPAFILKIYKKWMGKGLTQAVIGDLDPSLYTALYNWQRKNDLPAGFDLPTRAEVTKRELQSFDPETLGKIKRIAQNARRLETP